LDDAGGDAENLDARHRGAPLVLLDVRDSVRWKM
jgi:hypothetical protein